jgi:hypothetical protein
MREPPKRPAQTRFLVDMGAVRVAGAVGEAVVFAVGGGPLDQRTLDRHRAEYGQERT